MKKILFSLAAFAALATACQVEDINENITPEGEKYVIEAAITSTKTVYEPPFSVSWAEGDALSVVPQYTDGSYAGYEFKWTDGTTFVSENVTNPAEITELNVFYPYDDFIESIDGDGFENGYIYFGSRSDQAQTQNGTDDASHIAAPLYGYATVSAEGAPVVKMKHATTLFEVIVTNNAGKEISVANIKVSNSEDKKMIGQFYINPQTGDLNEGEFVSATANLNVTNGTIADNAKGNFYFTSAPFELAAGSTLTVTITTGDGESTIVKNIAEASAFEAGKVNHINVTVEEIETVDYMTVAEALATANDTEVNVQGLVTAVNSKGCVLSDETGYVYLYNGSNLNVEVGDYIRVTGTRGEYNDADQIEGPSVIVVSSGNPVSYPEPIVLDGSAADSFVSSPKAGYVQITGELSISGDYYNVIIPGAGSAQGSISYPRDTDTLAPYDGATVTVSGYYVGISGKRYLNIMLTDIKALPYCNVTPSTVSVTAEAGTTTFNISSNEYWMVESSNEAYTVSQEEGTGDAVITVTYPANEGTEPVEVVFTVLSNSGVEKTVTLTQRTASQTTVEVTDVLTTDVLGLVASNKTVYKNFSDIKLTSNAIYAGNAAYSNENSGAIQLRSSNSNSGIVTTSSNGKVRKIVVDWHTATSGSRVLWVYGSNEPFTSASELYNNNTQGERIAEIKMGDTTFEVEGDYSYIGLRSNSGAMYINSITVTWEE